MKKWKGDLVFVAVVAALVLGWLSLYPRTTESPLDPLYPPEDLADEDLPSYASYEGLKLSYRLYAPRGEVKHVLVFLHDTLLHGGWYAKLGRDLAANGVAVYLPDRRGRGRSHGTPREVSEDSSVLIEDITAMTAVAQARYPQVPIYLGGHGRGAGLAVRYVAAGRPVAGLVLISPLIDEAQPNVRPEGWSELLVAHPGEALLAQSGLVHWRVWRCVWPRAMVDEDPLIETRLSLADAEETVPEDPAAARRAVTVPLLLVQGQGDPLFHIDRTPELLSQFGSAHHHLETLPDACYLTAIEEAWEPVMAWLENQGS